MYNAKKSSIGGTGGQGADKELKDFYLKANIPTESLKTVSF